MAILEQKRQAVDAASRACVLCVDDVPASVRRSLAGFRPWIRHPFAEREIRIPKQGRDFRGQDGLVARI